MQKNEIIKLEYYVLRGKVNFSVIHLITHTEAVAQRYSIKKVFLEMSQKSQENTCARVSLLIKLQS